MTTKTKKAKKSTKVSAPKPRTKSAKQNAETSTHVPTPWAKLKQMSEAGESYEAMAKATDAHYDASKHDPTKTTRAKIWKARNIGVTIDGKLIRFGERGKAKPKPKKEGSHKKLQKKKTTSSKQASDAARTETEPQQALSPDLEQN